MVKNGKDTISWSFINDWPLRRYSILTLAFISLLLCFEGYRIIEGDSTITSLVGLLIIPSLLIVPGSGILRIGKYHNMGFIRSLFFSFCLGLGLLMIMGFLLNLFHYSGMIVSPLRMGPILITYALSTSAILLLARWRDETYVASVAVNKNEIGMIIIWTLSIALPFAVFLAASNINTIGSYSMMFWIVLLICLSPMIVYCRSRSFAPLVLSLSIALLLHRALITNYVLGYDVFSEFSAAYITTTNGWWNISQSLGIYGGSANTALSIITLAPMLTNLTGIQTVEMIKIVYPLLFSIVPLGIYDLFVEQFGTRPAFLGITVFIGYEAFYGLMVQLGKQGIAELFLIALLLAISSTALSRKKKMFLIVAFLSGVLVSHYGIAFLVIVIMFFVVALQALYHLYDKWKSRKEDWQGYSKWTINTIRTWISEQLRTRLITIELLIFAVAVFLVWYAFVGSGMVLPYVGIGETAQTRVVSDTGATILRRMDALEFLLINYGSNANNLEKYSVLFVQMATVLGVIWAFRDKKIFSKADKDLLFFGAAAAIFLVISYLVPGVSSSLYFGRVFTFTSIFLCGFFYLGVYAVLRSLRNVVKVRRPKISIPAIDEDKLTTLLAMLGAVLLLMTNTGVFTSLTDDYVGSLSIDETTSWAIYTDSDVTTAKWLSNPDHIGNRVPTADWHRFTIFGGLATPVNNLLYQFNSSSTDQFIYLSEWNNEYGYVYPLNTHGATTMSYRPWTEVSGQIGEQYDTVYSTSKFSTVVYIPPLTDDEIDRNPPGPPMYTYQDDPIYIITGVIGGLTLLGLASFVITRRSNKGR